MPVDQKYLVCPYPLCPRCNGPEQRQTRTLIKVREHLEASMKEHKELFSDKIYQFYNEENDPVRWFARIIIWVSTAMFFWSIGFFIGSHK